MAARPDGTESPERRKADVRASDYRFARIVAASVLVVVVGGMCAADIFVSGYQLDLPTLVVLGTMILTLLGLEARDLLRGKP